MNEQEVVAALLGPQVAHLEADGQHYFYFDPGAPLGVDDRWPFATLVTRDVTDPASQLGRAGIYRLNIGVSRGTYARFFGPPPPTTRELPVLDTGYDYAALGQLVPHPVYAPLGWVCILNPDVRAFGELRPLLDEARALAGRRVGARREPPAGREA